MNIRQLFAFALLLAAFPHPVAAQDVTILQQDYAMEMYFRFYLADCKPDEVRCLWLVQNNFQTGWKMTLRLATGSVETVRDTYDATRMMEHPNPGELSSAKIAAIRQLIAALPPSQDMFSMTQSVLIARNTDGRVQISQYNRIVPLPFIPQLYDLADSHITLGEDDLRDFIGLTAVQAEHLADFPRPWSVEHVLAWYAQAKTPDDRKFWAHVLAVSADPRAALALEKNLGQGDNTANLADIASYFMEKSASLHPVTPADAQKWYQDNHPRLEAQAAILSGLPPPAITAVAPNCPEVSFHEAGNPTVSFSEATVTIDRNGLAHIAVKRAVPLTRDFPLSPDLITALRKIIANNNFFTAIEPVPAPNPDLHTQLTIAADGQHRTTYQPWLPEFAPVRAYAEQLIFLTIASADANAPTVSSVSTN